MAALLDPQHRWDRAHWSVVADALAEADDLRARLIRADLDGDAGVVDELTCALVRDTPLPPGVHARWHRGFVTGIWLGWGEDALERLRRCLQDHPLLTRLSLGGQQVPADGLVELAGVPGIDRLERLSLSWRRLGQHRAVALGHVLDGVRPRHLALTGDAWVDPEAPILQHPGWEHVQRLDLGRASRGAGTSLALATRLRPTHLRIRNLSVAALAELSTRLDRCESLSFSRISDVWGSAADPAFASFLASPALTSLRELRLDQAYLPMDVVRALAARPPHLRYLAFRHVGGPRGWIRVLSEAPALRALEVLALERCGVGQAEALVLAESSVLDELTELRLGGHNLGVAGLQALATTDRLPALRRVWVDLWSHPVPPRARRQLEGSYHVHDVEPVEVDRGLRWVSGRSAYVLDVQVPFSGFGSNEMNVDRLFATADRQALVNAVCWYLAARQSDGYRRCNAQYLSVTAVHVGGSERPIPLDDYLMGETRLDAARLAAELPELSGPLLQPGEVSPRGPEPVQSLEQAWEDPWRALVHGQVDHSYYWVKHTPTPRWDEVL
ncbi:MAG: hypothetical protein KTR31_03775 [Myxococcales bacterium]|nr:hypothetical protein [Myxococcales bacterium]